jgi:Dockerin type I domain
MKILPLVLSFPFFLTVENSFAQVVVDSFIGGTLKTENAQPAKNVSITAIVNEKTVMSTLSSANGDFVFNIIPQSTYVIKPEKLDGDDKYKGISTFDIARITRHIMGIEPFTSPYQYIAADVDKNGEVDVADILHLRNFLLRRTQNLPSGVWRFVDKKYVFKDIDPFQEGFPETITISTLRISDSADFMAVKMGDVNNTYTGN